jgi:NADPH:quinone reductase-like Zn-dependent oxidoreductase
MRAITLDSPDTPPALREDLPDPAPADNEILVRAQASSANPADNSIGGGIFAGMGLEHQYPVTLGRDYAGVVEQTGAAVSSYKPGDRSSGSCCTPTRRRINRGRPGRAGRCTASASMLVARDRMPGCRQAQARPAGIRRTFERLY